MIGHKYKTE